MFNAMTNAEVVLAVGRVLREAASVDGTPDDYQRSQLLSAYSVARHLAAEEAEAASRLAWFREEAAEALPDRADALRATTDPARIGELVADALAERRASGEDAAPVHALLRELADLEVEALASPPR